MKDFLFMNCLSYLKIDICTLQLNSNEQYTHTSARTPTSASTLTQLWLNVQLHSTNSVHAFDAIGNMLNSGTNNDRLSTF